MWGCFVLYACSFCSYLYLSIHLNTKPAPEKKFLLFSIINLFGYHLYLVFAHIHSMKAMHALALLGHILLCKALYSSPRQPAYEPITYSSTIDNIVPVNNATVYKLSSNGSSPAIIVLDYGQDVEGYATFEVVGQSGNTSVFEMTYGETRAVLDLYMVGSRTTSTGVLGCNTEWNMLI